MEEWQLGNGCVGFRHKSLGFRRLCSAKGAGRKGGRGEKEAEYGKEGEGGHRGLPRRAGPACVMSGQPT